MKLIKYRDAQMENYIYFWVENDVQRSPNFISEEEAHRWVEDSLNTVWDNWKATRDIA